MSYLDLLREEFPETPSPRELQKLQKAPSDNPSELQKLQKAPFYSFYSSHSRGVLEIKPAEEAKPPLSPELESLIRRASVHYECPPDELPLMLEAARNDPEKALIYYRGIAAELDLVPDPAMVQTLSAKVYCAGCGNIRMEEVVIPGVGRRYMWGCAKGHLEHGHSTPELPNLLAPESCIAALDFAPVAIMNTTERNALQ